MQVILPGGFLVCFSPPVLTSNNRALAFELARLRRLMQSASPSLSPIALSDGAEPDNPPP